MVPIETDQLAVAIAAAAAAAAESESWCCRNRIHRNHLYSHCNRIVLVLPDLVAPADSNRTALESTVDLLDRVRDLKRAPLPRKPCSCCTAVEDRTTAVADRRMKLDLDHTVLDRDQG